MACEAIMLRDPDTFNGTLVAACAGGEVYQMPNGQAGVRTGLAAMAIGDVAGFTTVGQHTVLKTVDIVFVKGDPVYWDHSANKATFAPASDKDFFLGTAVADAAAAATTMVVNINVRPAYKIDLNRGDLEDEFLSVIVKTVVGSTTVEVPHINRFGGVHSMIFGATAEAQKLDLLSQQGFALGSNWVAEFGINVIDDGDAAAIDFSIGVANGTHATDADAITESALFHLDGNDLNLFAESDDGTTEVAATDTTFDLVLGTPVHLKLDGRDPTNVKFYVNGVEKLAATTNLGNITLAAGPLKLLAHLEKTSDDTTADFRVQYMRVRTMELD